MPRLAFVLAALAALAGCREPAPSAVEPALIRSAQVACMQERVSEGLARLDSLNDAHPGNADVLAMRGQCRSVRFAADSVQADARAAFDDLSSALALIEAAPGTFQTPPAGLYNQRSFVVQSMRPDDAPAMIADLDRAVRLAPSNPVFVLNRGVARAMAGDTARAHADLRRFVALAPADSASAGALRSLLGDRPAAGPAAPDSVLSFPLAP